MPLTLSRKARSVNSTARRRQVDSGQVRWQNQAREKRSPGEDIAREEIAMDANTKKTALRMIPYGLFVLTAKGKNDEVAAATVNWVTQASFAPPLVVVGVKTDSHAHALIKESKAFALNVLGKGQTAMAFTFFKPAAREGQSISGEPFRSGTTGAPILERAPAFVECRLVDTVERGDHSVFVGEVVEAGVAKPIEGRADDATLWLKELGPNVFYGG
jgi:flavin reductase (DIM6/NTAB) family NADH-FMN oxidoreductase RutF